MPKTNKATKTRTFSAAEVTGYDGLKVDILRAKAALKAKGIHDFIKLFMQDNPKLDNHQNSVLLSDVINLRRKDEELAKKFLDWADELLIDLKAA